ncbi:MAG: integration host factor subunit alpha [Deltaproteobacteria bacterium]|jgi:integration host factor subunit alpha|nr:integration host factor subunit alpha [Deltaproteobacteria bacterium]
MTKADLVEAVYAQLEGASRVSKRESADLVELVFDTLKDNLAAGDKVKISGFGNFVVRQKKPRVGRNPQTGKEITISERKVLSFKASQVLKSSLNA